MKLAVVLLRWAGVQIRNFDEVVEVLAETLRDLGADVEVRDNSFAPDRKNIVVGANLLGWNRLEPPPGSVLYNLEQLARGSPWTGEDVLGVYRRHEVWTYTEETRRRLLARGIKARLVRFGRSKAWAPYRDAPRVFDATLVGNFCPRRDAVVARLEAAGLSVFYSDKCFGEERDAVYRVSRAVLNVHYYDDAAFEIVRSIYPLARGRVVVTERTGEVEEGMLGPGLRAVSLDELAGAIRSISPEDERLAPSFDLTMHDALREALCL